MSFGFFLAEIANSVCFLIENRDDVPSFHLTLTQCASVPCCGLHKRQHREEGGMDALEVQKCDELHGLLCSWAVGV